MKLIHKRKSITATSAKQSLSRLPIDETWIYGTGKLLEGDYHNLSFLSAHVIKDLANKNLSDYFLWRKYIKRNLPEPEKSAGLKLGSAFHMAALEPKIYYASYCVMPKCDRRTKQGKADYAAFIEANQGKEVIDSQIDETARVMAKTVLKNKYAKALLKGCHNEVTGFKRIGKNKILKGRIDSVNFDGRYGVDLKSIDDVSPAGFAKAAANFRYDIQALTYMKLFDLDEFIFIVCGKSEPHEVAIYSLNDEFMQKAADDLPFAVERWNSLHSMKTPASFTNDDNPMTVLAPPSWFKYI